MTTTTTELLLPLLLFQSFILETRQLFCDELPHVDWPVRPATLYLMVNTMIVQSVKEGAGCCFYVAIVPQPY